MTDETKGVDKLEIYEHLPNLEEITALMQTAYEDLQQRRKLYDKINEAYYNIFPEDNAMEYNKRSTDILKSGFCHSAVEIASRGMKMPIFTTQASSTEGNDKVNAQEGAKAALEWIVKESGFQNTYDQSKEHWAKYGDAYRRQYVRPIKGQEGRYWPQHELLDPYYVLLDSSATQVWSQNPADSITYYGYTQIYDKKQLKKEVGPEMMEFIKPGALIDIDEYSKRTGTKKDVPYYERLEIIDSSNGEKYVLWGQEGFPSFVCIDKGKKPKFPKEWGKHVRFSDTYKNKTKIGELDVDLHNTYFFYDSRNVRNLGVVHKLIPSQFTDQLVENLKLEATRLKMIEIPTIAGGKESLVNDSINRFMEGRETNIMQFLHAPSNIEGIIPKFDVLRFQGVSAEDAAQTTRDTYDFARNNSGIDLSRLQIQSNVTLGQSQLIEQEKTDTLETIIVRNKPSIEREYESMFYNFIEYEGYGLSDIFVSYDYRKEMPGVSEDEQPMVIQTKREVDLVTLAKELAPYKMQIVIDDSSLVNRTYTTLLDSWIRLLGVVNPAVVPKLYQFLMEKIAEAGRFTIPKELFKGVEQQTAPMGGDSQFTNPAPNEQPESDITGLPPIV